MWSALVPRRDVRFRHSGEHLYVCRGDGAPLRLRGEHAEGEPRLCELPGTALSDLAERDLLVPNDEPMRRHPSFAHSWSTDLRAEVVGGDQLSSAVTGALVDFGVEVDAGSGVVVLPLTAPDETVRERSERAVREGVPVLVFAVAGARVYFAVLRPPDTACPLCLASRIRSNRSDQELGRLPLEMLLGTASDAGWPSTAAAAGLLAHQALRAITAPGSCPEGLVDLDLDTCRRTTHPLLHTPCCPACRDHVGPPATALVESAATAESASSAGNAERLRRAVDPLTGIIAGIRVTGPDDPGSAVDSTMAWGRGGTDTTWFSPVRSSTVGGATKHDPVEAEVCAIGETLERYAAGIYDPDEFVRGSLAELGTTAVDPRDLPLGSEREYERATGTLFPYEPDLVIDWTAGVDLETGEQHYVPACAVYVPYLPPRKRERLFHPVSTGLAAGSAPAQALRGGLQETAERDAMAVFWYNRLIRPTLDWRSLPSCRARDVLEGMTRRGISLTVKDLTTDTGIPAVVVLGRVDTPERPVALCGFRADVGPYAALLGAAEELEHVFSMYWRFAASGGELDPTREPSDIWDFTTYYCHRSRIPILDFMHEGPLHPAPSPPSEPLSDAEAVHRLVGLLSGSGHRCLATDITPVDVAECGVTVVRTVVPGLQPISFSPAFRRLGGSRVYQAPVRMGLRATPQAEDELNPYPVPMG
nr:TOMM precursor leader peptide-binding protein [Actinopolyspora biskrensis]